MQKTVFGVDDIHRLRLETAERYSKMTPEEARADRRKNADDTRRAVEELRAAKTAYTEPRP
jgi:hypothetical protein